MEFTRTFIDTLKEYVFKKVPSELTAEFEEHIYKQNLPRFGTLLMVVLFIHAVSFAFYGYQHLSDSTISWLKINIGIANIVIEFLLLVYFMRRPQYNAGSFVNRNSDILLAATILMFILAEYLLTPQDAGYMLRAVVSPLILSAAIILSNKKAILLNAIVVAAYSIPAIGIVQVADTFTVPSYILNLWLVVLPCLIVIPGFVYSGFVRNYLNEIKEQKFIAELEKMNSQLDLLSRRDKLTGLSNQRDLEQFIELTWNRELRNKNHVTVIIMDIDYFHRFTEQFGTAAADRCLVTLAHSMQTYFTVSDYIFARLHGDIFMVVMYGQKHSQMVILGEELRMITELQQLENPFNKESLYVTLSCGVATMPVTEEGFGKAEEIANRCVKIAAHKGGNKVMHFDWTTGDYMDADYNIVKKSVTHKKECIPSQMDFEHLNSNLKKLGLECSFIYSSYHDVLEFTQYAQELLGMPNKIHKPNGQKIVDMIRIAPEEKARFTAEMKQAIASLQPQIEMELNILLDNSERAKVAMRMSCIYDSLGKLIFTYGNLFKINNIYEIAKHLDKMDMVNNITGLPNRTSFYKRMRGLMQAENGNGYIIMFDIHNFKSINGIFGHNIGDNAIKKVGEVLEKMARHRADVYHYALDQFILVFTNTDSTALRDFVKRVERFFLTSHTMVDDVETRIQFKIGGVAFDAERRKLDELMLNLDVALQKAKSDINTSFHIFDGMDKTEYLGKINLERDIFDSVHSNFKGFSLNYQPLYSMAGECVGAEALLRWSNNGMNIPPSAVIPSLENTGLIKKVGEWILDTASKQCAEWIAAGAPKDFYVHVNLSVVQVDKKAFVEDVVQTVAKNGIMPHNIVLEITESVFVSEQLFVTDVFNELRDMGFRISIDDFGTGYSSLSYLRTLPVNQIKIDRFFLNDIEKDPTVRNILRSIAELIDSMGFSVCIEGLETVEQLAAIRDLPIQLLQGYLLAKPKSAEEFEVRNLPLAQMLSERD